MPNSYVMIAAAILAGAAQPGLAAAQQTQRPAAAQPAQQQPNRATLLRNLDANFQSLDTNKDGSLSQAELAAAEAKAQQQRLAQVRAQADAQFTRLDTNRDGQLSKTEFMAAVPQRPAAAATGAGVLAQLDRNKDQKVSIDEYRTPMLAGFDRFDTNKDGTISPAERAAAAQAQNRR